ncbi:unnamed protein product, partial [Heterobilharzia americana]
MRQLRGLSPINRKIYAVAELFKRARLNVLHLRIISASFPHHPRYFSGAGKFLVKISYPLCMDGNVYSIHNIISALTALFAQIPTLFTHHFGADRFINENLALFTHYFGANHFIDAKFPHSVIKLRKMSHSFRTFPREMKNIYKKVSSFRDASKKPNWSSVTSGKWT